MRNFMVAFMAGLLAFSAPAVAQTPGDVGLRGTNSGATPGDVVLRGGSYTARGGATDGIYGASPTTGGAGNALDQAPPPSVCDKGGINPCVVGVGGGSCRPCPCHRSICRDPQRSGSG
jgi:hypothetical protein